MREYELTVLIHPDLEADLEKPLTKVRDLIKSQSGEITSEENMGKKRLAYKIAGQDFAVYVGMVVRLPGAGVAKVDATLNITDEVLRHLLVAVDEKQRTALTAAKEREVRRAGESDQQSEE
jgi:small subunit ribosomal protein S6